MIVTDDNPRGEDGDAIVADILAGFAGRMPSLVQRDRAAAIARAIGEAGPSDIVLIAGKGHEPYQEVAGVRHPFDDTAVARARCCRSGRMKPLPLSRIAQWTGGRLHGADVADRRGRHRYPHARCQRRPRRAVRRAEGRAFRRPRPRR